MENVEAASTLRTPAPSRLLARVATRDQLLNPWPRIGWRTVVAVVMIGVVYVWGLRGTHVDLGELAAGVPNIVNFIVRLFPPDFQLETIEVGLPALATPPLSLAVPEIVFAIIETVQMAVIGTSVAIFAGIPFGLLAARNTAPHPLVYQAIRMVMNINRAVPEIIFALVFVAAVGLGPFGGVLALAVGSIGAIGKMYAEAIEAIDPQQVLALRATGANRLQIFLYSVVPQAMPVMASYSLYLFEHNVRSATILGLVGAGGVGFIIAKYIALFQYHQLMGALLLIVLMVTVVDRVSDFLRTKIT